MYTFALHNAYGTFWEKSPVQSCQIANNIIIYKVTTIPGWNPSFMML